jgi:hypothetical protein
LSTARRAPDRTAGKRARVEAPAPPLPVALLVLIAGWVALLVLAPPENNFVWAVNGFRSVSIEARLLLVMAAACAAFLPSLRGWRVFLVVAAMIAVVTAFPLRERIHLLGDTQVRIRSMVAFSEQIVGDTLREWSRRLHANPLDIVVDFLAPIGLGRITSSLTRGVSVVAGVLALAYFGGLWQITGRLGTAPALRLALGLALGLAGTLQVFAGYAESTGLLLATAAWWWAMMLAPLDRRGRAWRLGVAWLLLLLGHRLALVLVLPQAVRLLGPPLEGDRPEPRRFALGLCAGALVLALGAMFLGTGGAQLASDWRDLFGGGAPHLPRLLSLPDALNTLVLVAPLALPALLLAGAAGVRAFVRRPDAGILAAAILPLIPIGLMLPVADSGLGAQRDFDLNALLGLTLSIAGAALIARVAAGRASHALRLVLPALVIGAFGFVMVNADEPVAMRRALAMASQPPPLAPAHSGTLHVFLGQRAMDTGHLELAGAYYDKAFEVGGNPRRALLAAEAWTLYRDTRAARRSLAAARSRGPLNPSLARAAASIEATLADFEAAAKDSAAVRDSAAARASTGGAPR